jgi:hypothetical protein
LRYMVLCCLMKQDVVVGGVEDHSRRVGYWLG